MLLASLLIAALAAAPAPASHARGDSTARRDSAAAARRDSAAAAAKRDSVAAAKRAVIAALAKRDSVAAVARRDSVAAVRRIILAAGARHDSAVAAAARDRFTAPMVPASIDSIVVEKKARRLTLFSAGGPVRIYRVALGNNPIGAKRVQGDGRTPEGLYVIDHRNPQSKYYRSLHISYPNAVDKFLASEKGYTAGGEVMIHGLPAASANLGASHTQWDWTEGCVALSNDQMDEVWSAVADGTPIRIKP